MVGNGATNWSYDVWPSFAATAANMNVISMNLWKEIEDNGCEAYFHGVRPATKTPKCIALAAKA